MSEHEDQGVPRQRVVRVPGARRARLTPAPDTDPSPEAAEPGGARTHARPKDNGPNDDRMFREVPPHY